jgi:hypothetical protein
MSSTAMTGVSRVATLRELLAPYCVLVFVGALVHVAVSYGPVYLLHGALVLVGARLVLEVLRADRMIVALPRGLLEWSAVAFVGVYLMSWAWSVDRSHSTAYVGYLLIGVGTALATAALACTRAGMVRLLWLAGAITTLQIILCLLEIWTPFRLPISPFSEYARLFGREDKLAGIGMFGALLQQILQSPTGFHWNPNNLAIVMVLAIAFFINLRSVAIRWIGVACALTVIVFTASRASLLGALVVFFVYLVVLSPRRLGVAVAVLPLLVSGLWFTAQQLDRLAERLGPVASAVDAATSLFAARAVLSDSIGIRQQLMNNSIASIRQTSGVGVGPGGSILVQRAAGGAAAEIGSTHNFWLEIAVDGGLLALFLFVTWYASAWLSCMMAATYSRDPIFNYAGRSLACALAGFSVALVSASSVLYFPPMWAMFGAIIGLSRARSRGEHLKEGIEQLTPLSTGQAQGGHP